MTCANCRTDESPAYTLRAHVDDRGDDQAVTDGGRDEAATVDLQFCSFDCLETWT